MAFDSDSLARLQILEQRLAALEAAAETIPPVAADRGQAVTVHATYSGNLGDAVKCVSGAWSALTVNDAVSGPIGIVIGLSSTWAEIQIAGPRVAAGTPGATYFAPASAGAPTPTDPGGGNPPFSIPMERQIAPNLRIVGGIGGGGGDGSVLVTAAGFGGAPGDVLKCVAGAWSHCTDADAGHFLVGIILSVDGVTSDASILVYGTGAHSGTQGVIYFAPHSSGAMTPTRPTPATPPTVSPWERIVAVQLTAAVVQVLQVPAVRYLATDDCEITPVTHYIAETAL